MGAYVARKGWDAEAAPSAKTDEATGAPARLECEVRGRGGREEGGYSKLRYRESLYHDSWSPDGRVTMWRT